jgi:hypothetical protein
MLTTIKTTKNHRPQEISFIAFLDVQHFFFLLVGNYFFFDSAMSGLFLRCSYTAFLVVLQSSLKSTYCYCFAYCRKGLRHGIHGVRIVFISDLQVSTAKFRFHTQAKETLLHYKSNLRVFSRCILHRPLYYSKCCTIMFISAEIITLLPAILIPPVNNNIHAFPSTLRICRIPNLLSKSSPLLFPRRQGSWSVMLANHLQVNQTTEMRKVLHSRFLCLQ